MKAASAIAQEKRKKRQTKPTLQVETSLSGYDPLRRRPTNRSINTLDRLDVLRDCFFRITFCRQNREETAVFRQDERICLKLFVENTASDCISIATCEDTYFGRGGLSVQIEGMEPLRINWRDYRYLELAPNQTYTYFKILTKPKKDEQVAYATPPPGHYVAKVWVFGQPLQNTDTTFSVVANEKQEAESEP